MPPVSKGKYLGNAEKTSSRVITSLTSSWAVTASYALNANSSTDVSIAQWVAAASGNLASVTSSLMSWSASAKTSIAALNTATASINGKSGSWTSAASWVGANSASLVSSASAAKSAAAWIAANSGAIGSSTGSSHSHSNKALLDSLTNAKTSSWDSKTDNTGTVTSITVTTGSNYMAITSGGVAITSAGTRRVDLATTTKNKIESGSLAFNWVSANSASFVSGNHFHNNKALLDSLTNAKTGSWDAITPVSEALYKFGETVLPRYLGDNSRGAFYIQTNINTGSNRFLYFDIEEYLYKPLSAPGHTIIQAYWSTEYNTFQSNYRNMIHLGSPIGSNINLVADSEGYIGLFFNVEQNWGSLKIRMNRGSNESNSTSNAFIRTSVRSLKSGSSAETVTASAAVFVAPNLQYLPKAETSETSSYAVNASASFFVKASRNFDRVIALGGPATSLTESTSGVPLHFRESLTFNPSSSYLTITPVTGAGYFTVDNKDYKVFFGIGSAGVNRGIYLSSSSGSAGVIKTGWGIKWDDTATASFGSADVSPYSISASHIICPKIRIDSLYATDTGGIYKYNAGTTWAGGGTDTQVFGMTDNKLVLRSNDSDLVHYRSGGVTASSVVLDTVNYLGNVNGRILAQPIASSSGTSGTVTLASGRFTKCGTLTATLTLKTGSSVGNDRQDIYAGNFSMGDTVYTVNWPAGIKWVEGNPDVTKPNSTYEFSIVDNVGILVRTA